MARKIGGGSFTPTTVEFPEAEKRFLKHHEVCRVSTSQNDNPHITPVNFVSVDNKAVIIQGVVEFIERGEEFQKLYDIFYQKFDWVRQDPWKEGEAPFVKVKPLHKVSWGF